VSSKNTPKKKKYLLFTGLFFLTAGEVASTKIDGDVSTTTDSVAIPKTSGVKEDETDEIFGVLVGAGVILIVAFVGVFMGVGVLVGVGVGDDVGVAVGVLVEVGVGVGVSVGVTTTSEISTERVLSDSPAEEVLLPV